jgi:PAS domain S-box-containing protein
MSGYEQDDILGKHFSQIVPPAGDYEDITNEAVKIDGDYINQHALEFERLSENDKSIRTLFYRCKDGKLLPAECTFALLRDHQGIRAGTVSIIRNIGDTLRTERNSRNSLELLENVFQNASDGIMVTDKWGLIVKANKAVERMLGLNLETIMGRSPAELVPDRMIERTSDDEIKQMFLRLNEQGFVENFESTFKRSDGELCHVVMDVSCLKDSEGNFTGTVTTMRNVTERLKMEQQMLRAKRLESISTLAEGIANDFNAILTAILGEINMAQSLISADAQVFSCLERAERETMRARDLSEQLMIFSKGGKLAVQKSSIIDILKRSAEHALQRPDIQYELNCGADVWAVNIDREQIQQVFKSLLINAEHAMPEGGTIRIKAENITVDKMSNEALNDGRYVKITLSDQGIGILNEYIQDIFDPYFMKGRKRSGLVLATAYSVIKKHGGVISVESEFGSGTSFYIYLPALTE